MSVHLVPQDGPLSQEEALGRIVASFGEVLISRSAGRARADAVRQRLRTMGAPEGVLAEYTAVRVDSSVLVQCCDSADSGDAVEFLLGEPVGSVLIGFEDAGHAERCRETVAKIARIWGYDVVPD